MVRNILSFLLVIFIMLAGCVVWYYQRSVKYYPVGILESTVRKEVSNFAEYRRKKVDLHRFSGELTVDISFAVKDEAGLEIDKKAHIRLAHPTVFEEKVLTALAEDVLEKNKKAREKEGSSFIKNDFAVLELRVGDHIYSQEELERINTSIKFQKKKYPLSPPVPYLAERNYFKDLRSKGAENLGRQEEVSY